MEENSRSRELARWVLPGATLLFYLVTVEGYGYFRDELYYLANARHLGWGYVDHPPLIGWLAAAVTLVFGDSLLAIRALPAVCAALVVRLTMLLVARLGGGRYAEIVAGTASWLLPIHLGLFSFLSMNAVSLALWAAAILVFVEVLEGRRPRGWITFGVLAGIGLLSKIDMLFLGGGVALSLLATRRWFVLRDRQLWLGGVVAVLLFLPHLIWQVRSDWPTLEFMRNAREYKITGGLGSFLSGQIEMAGPVFLLLAVLGTLLLLRRPREQPAAALGWLIVAVFLLLALSGTAKPYYLAPVYTPALAAGAVALERWASSRRSPKLWGGIAAAALVLTSVPLMPLAKPLLPVETFLRYAGRIGLIPSSGENHELGELPQHFADMHGWPELARTVGAVAAALPPAERERACVFAQNYGEAGALEHFGRDLGMPPVISGHNSYYLWGPGECDGSLVIVIGGSLDDLVAGFEAVEPGAQFECRYCMPYENNQTIWVARGSKRPIAEVWPNVKHYD